MHLWRPWVRKGLCVGIPPGMGAALQRLRVLQARMDGGGVLRSGLLLRHARGGGRVWRGGRRRAVLGGGLEAVGEAQKCGAGWSAGHGGGGRGHEGGPEAGERVAHGETAANTTQHSRRDGDCALGYGWRQGAQTRKVAKTRQQAKSRSKPKRRVLVGHGHNRPTACGPPSRQCHYSPPSAPAPPTQPRA